MRVIADHSCFLLNDFFSGLPNAHKNVDSWRWDVGLRKFSSARCLFTVLNSGVNLANHCGSCGAGVFQQCQNVFVGECADCRENVMQKCRCGRHSDLRPCGDVSWHCAEASNPRSHSNVELNLVFSPLLMPHMGFGALMHPDLFVDCGPV